MELDLAHELAVRGIQDAAVLAAVARVDRARFVGVPEGGLAPSLTAVPLGIGQLISQPYVVASMTSALGVTRGARVLEIGTGSGYQTAVLSELGCEVFSLEPVQALAERAAVTLASLGIRVHLRVSDGARGWPEEAPFDGILVTAAAPGVPQPLLAQLEDGARLVAPVGGTDVQDLMVVKRVGSEFEWRSLFLADLVPPGAPGLH